MSTPGHRCPKGVDYFGRGHWLSDIQSQFSLRARRKMYELWKREAGKVEGLDVLDVGGTPDQELADSNCIVRWLLDDGVRVSMYSPEDIGGLAEVFQGVRILETVESGRKFDWVICSAVLEHVGSRDQQEAFCGMWASHASKGLWLTTPYRFHWMEFHTKLPLLHWLPRRLHRLLLGWLGKSPWDHESHLRLVGAGELREIARKSLPDLRCTVCWIWALGMPSNLMLVAKRA